MTEEWRDIVGWEGIYRVSSHGRVASVARNGPMKPGLSRTGYVKIALTKHGRSRNYSAHRLVAEAFLPLDPGRPQINHKDGCKTNNLVENLEWCTSAENTDHAIVLGLRKRGWPTRRGEEQPHAKLTWAKVREIRRRYPSETMDELSAAFGVVSSRISNIIHNKAWRELPTDPVAPVETTLSVIQPGDSHE